MGKKHAVHMIFVECMVIVEQQLTLVDCTMTCSLSQMVVDCSGSGTTTSTAALSIYSHHQDPERFVGVVHVDDTSSATLKASIDTLITQHKLSLKQVRGQGYNGASNMCSEFNGLKALILKDNNSTYYVHCFAHQLQLVIVVIAKHHKGLVKLFEKLIGVINVVSSSCKKKDMIRDNYKDDDDKSLVNISLDMRFGVKKAMLGFWRRIWFNLTCMGIVLSVRGYCIECAWYLYYLHSFIIPLPSLQSVVTIIEGMSIIIQGISSSGINGCISHTSSISETDHNMSTNAKLPTCDIKTGYVIPNEAADASLKVEISPDMPVTKNVVKRKQDKPDKGSKSNLELFLDQLGLNLTGTIIVMLGRMWDKASVKAGGFVRYPFQLQDFDGIESSDNKYLIDKVYLSSTSSTIIYDDDAIPAIKALKKANIVVNHQTSGTSVELSQPRAGNLENLLMWARNRKNDVYCFLPNLFWIYHSSITPNLQRLSLQSITFQCKVTIDGIRTKKGWNFPSYGSGTYNTAQVVVVMFNETATALVNCSANSLMDTVDESSEDHLNLPPALSNLIGVAHVMEIKSHTYYEYRSFESFTCWQILSSEGIDDSVGSSNLNDYPDNQP
nr:hypothetical protein [Tanacetum cinerariifolium]